MFYSHPGINNRSWVGCNPTGTLWTRLKCTTKAWKQLASVFVEILRAFLGDDDLLSGISLKDVDVSTSTSVHVLSVSQGRNCMKWVEAIQGLWKTIERLLTTALSDNVKWYHLVKMDIEHQNVKLNNAVAANRTRQKHIYQSSKIAKARAQRGEKILVHCMGGFNGETLVFYTPLSTKRCYVKREVSSGQHDDVQQQATRCVARLRPRPW